MACSGAMPGPSLETLLAADSFAELEARLKKRSAEELRPDLIRTFFELVEYRNAEEWNRLVRVCEALAIVGWGDVEPVEARAAKWMNGSFYTELENRFFEKRFLSSRWCKQGKTFILDEHARYYYASPERPGQVELDTSAYAATHPGVDRKDYGVAALASQSNPLPKNPVRLERSGNFFPSFEPFIGELEKLKHRLDRETRPETYGASFGYVGIRCNFSNEWSDYVHDQRDVPRAPRGKPFVRQRIDYGKLAVKAGETRIVNARHFPSAFAEQPLAAQKQAFAADLIEMLEDLAARLKKKKLAYDAQALTSDVSAILERW
jgi:hypothetical protein